MSKEKSESMGKKYFSYSNNLLVIDNVVHLISFSNKKLKAFKLTIIMLNGRVGVKSVKSSA